MPVIVKHVGPDHHAILVVKSVAFFIYLGEKHDHFAPLNPIACGRRFEWMMFKASAHGQCSVGGYLVKLALDR